MHTNDESVLVCGTPIFGREKNKDGSTAKTDAIEVGGVAPGYVFNGGCPTSPPAIWSPTGKFSVATKALKLPASNSALATVAESGGKVYTGKTIIHLRSNVMDVTTHNLSTGAATTTTNVAWPGNGVLYVKSGGTCTGEIPTDADYDESVTCGNVYVSGTYAKPLTIAAANDVIIRPTAGATLLAKTKDSDIKLADGSDATLGLIANNFVRVGPQGQPRHQPLQQLQLDERADRHRRPDRRRDHVAAALLHRRQLRLRPVRHADRQRRDRAEVPRPGRHRQRRNDHAPAS